MERPQASMLSGGRLHFHHGPIDLILKAEGAGAEAAHIRAWRRFETVLDELVSELPALRRPAEADRQFSGRTARRMQAAVVRFLPVFITPMAAVAGAVAAEILAAMTDGSSLRKAWVNNGGDIAFHLADGERTDAAIAAPLAGRISISSCDPVRGIATSGWRGRSHSFGIADSVTVLAADAPLADAAATLIANAVDLPGHTAVTRTPANILSPDSDLGARLVTTAVGPLAEAETARALDAGLALADRLAACGTIHSAILILNGQSRVTAGQSASLAGDRIHA